MNNTVTWQAHTVMKVEQECLTTGFFPNGKRLTEKNKQESREQIEACNKILTEYGIHIQEQQPKGQLQLF